MNAREMAEKIFTDFSDIQGHPRKRKMSDLVNLFEQALEQYGRERYNQAIEDSGISCDCCGATPTNLYDSQGEGRFWLCDSRDEEHVEGYCGILIRALKDEAKS